MFGRKQSLTAAQNCALVCCAVLSMRDIGPKAIMRMDIPGQKPQFGRELLAKHYDISDSHTANETIGNLAQIRGQVSFVSEIFDHIIGPRHYEIVRGMFTPFKAEDLPALDISANFPLLWADVTNNANDNLNTYLEYLHNPEESRPGATFHNITSAALVNRINKCISSFEHAVRSLKVFGYSMDELGKVNNFAALDLTHAAHAARLAAHAGFIDEAAAWKHMTTAGKAAYATYTGWRPYLAAYFLGRAIAKSAEDFGDYGDIIRYLLRDKKSPFFLHPLKT